ncbi:MAG: 4Fe-4S binding protein [Bacteroidia bacterium]|nr:4Fe-4S binding protein [Bacteroidia bacterium]MCX7651644.1 4Fe-4S binding protein [Bacteroidia bacterium]MDW8415970.1 4Fe-4S binding protein [Bacteroidia bacterium]
MYSLLRGLLLALRHGIRGWRKRTRHPLEQGAFASPLNGAVTLSYPHARFPVPENGHYRLHVTIEDCIGCDLCARVCPVNCITIEKQRSQTLLGYTSSGAPRRFHLPRFDIDHALCCFCGLCTVVCPTECIVMEPVYDYATDDRAALVLRFGERSDVPS